LFLDTWPYNAHSTAREALWAGVPVLTMTGRSFASRGASSLLHGLDMDELVTQNQDAYRARAFELVSQSERLTALRTHLTASRNRSVFSAQRLFGAETVRGA
jgi:predicted O-linked N-acetylglucosamine transferase (SPINDLY family)